MTGLERVFVLAGGLSVERDVSLRSGRRIADALRGVGVDAVLLDSDAQLIPRLQAESPDAVFIALHGGPGEDGALRGVLELMGVAYAGTSAHACRLAFDKPTAKSLVRGAGLTTPPWLALPHATFRELGAAAVISQLVDRLGLPLMVKPAHGGSALGVSVVGEASELPGALVASFGYADTALIERFVEGTEIAVAVIDAGEGPVALPAVEIEPLDGPYDYAARYTAGATEFYVPARVSAEVATEAARVAVRAHEVLGLADISRTDCIVDAAGQVNFLEVNVSPGMTETSLVPLAVTAAGRDLGVICRDLLSGAMTRLAVPVS
jgi:D-alanine-D-alanine ligase